LKFWAIPVFEIMQQCVRKWLLLWASNLYNCHRFIFDSRGDENRHLLIFNILSGLLIISLVLPVAIVFILPSDWFQFIFRDELIFFLRSTSTLRGFYFGYSLYGLLYKFTIALAGLCSRLLTWIIRFIIIIFWLRLMVLA
jgi:hypothetical protein